MNTYPGRAGRMIGACLAPLLGALCAASAARAEPGVSRNDSYEPELSIQIQAVNRLIEDDNQGLDDVFMIQINKDGSFRAVSKLAM